MTAETEYAGTPDRRPINAIQAHRLASLAGIELAQIEGRSVEQLSEELRWRVDPRWFRFERVCGQVVKTDPITHTDRPVPFATVHVQDTDCSFLGYYPLGWKYGWMYPVWCTRHDLATVVTDACGRFCVWIPRWDIEWILEWRKQRICYPIIFLRPTIRDLLTQLEYPQGIFRPPLPDPPPDLLTDGGMTLRRAQEALGPAAASILARQELSSSLGSTMTAPTELLDQRAHPQSVPPPHIHDLAHERGHQRRQLLDEHLGAMSARFELQDLRAENLQRSKFIGPFWRCYDVLLPEWVPIYDAPDITFWVTQDADNDGDQETIYSESWFDVRWDAENIPPVTLHASQIAQVSLTCDVPPVNCENVPQLQFVGLMPLINPASPIPPYHDAVTGYAKRPNRPHSLGTFAQVPAPSTLSEAPYTWTLQLYGCNHAAGAQFYRLEYKYESSSSWLPFKGLTWPLHRVVGSTLETIWPSPDPDGWYPILPDADGWDPSHLLLNWPTTNGSYADGEYTVRVQLGDGAKTMIVQSSEVALQIDNSVPQPAPTYFTELRWRPVGGAWSAPLELICPVITRPKSGGVPVDIEIEVSYAVMATHLRSVELTGGGCGAGNVPLVEPPISTYQHWYTNPADNSVANTAVFSVPHTDLPGAYSFMITAASRAFNPAGGDGGFEADWNYDPVYNYVTPTLPVAIVDAP